MGFGKQTFEIRKGRSGSQSEEPKQKTAPIGAISLPQSITSSEADEHLKKRFGVEQLPEVDARHSKVTLTQSEGIGGPSRTGKSMLVVAVLLLLGGGAALLFFAHKNGQLDQWLGQ